MKVLFIGGTGIISSACSELAVAQGIDLYHLNRGQSKSIRNIDGVKHIYADIRDVEATAKAIEAHSFDAVVDWIAFTPEHIQNDIQLFSGKTKQFVFISSASIYETPPAKLPVTEETPLYNPIWKYSQDKIACEDLLREEYDRSGFPYTIVRPSHTYDKTLIPVMGDYTAIHRMKNGLPVVAFGDGSSIWTLTNNKDFAVGLVGLLGKEKAIGDAFHITNNELLTWNMIYELIAKELGVEAKLVYVPSEVINKYDKDLGDGLLGDKSCSMIFDNTKIKSIVPEFDPKTPYSEGVKDMVNWYLGEASDKTVDPHINDLMERIINDHTATPQN